MDKQFDREAVGEFLQKILESGTFGKSERARNLLRYIVEEDLAGKASELKGFTIAMDVFGKDESFEATTDPLVRVHAGRLRDLLTAYYLEEGKDDKVRISIPLGGYQPIYELADDDASAGSALEPNEPQTPETDDVGGLEVLTTDAQSLSSSAEISKLTNIARQPSPIVKKQIKFIWIALTSLCLIAGSLVYYLLNQTADRADLLDGTQQEQENIASASFLPVLRVLTDTEDDEMRRFAERFVTALSRFDTITTLKLANNDLISQRAGKWSPLDYGFNITNVGQKDGKATIIKIELIALQTAQILRGEEFPIDIWEQPGVQAIIARKLGIAATPEGVVYADILAKGNANPLLDCLIKVRLYYSLSNRKTHKAAYECTKELAGAERANGLLLAIYGGLQAEASGKNFEYSDLSEEPDEAMSAALIIALKGVDNAPLSARSAREVGFIYSWRGAFTQMTEWFEQANTLNPYDTSIAASYGYGLVLTGEYKKAAVVLQDAIGATNRHPNWWRLYCSLALLMDDRIDEAKEMIEPIGLAKRTLYYTLLNAVFAFRKNDEIRAAYLVRELKEKYPKFAANPQGSFEKRHFPKGLIDTLVEGLQKSGI